MLVGCAVCGRPWFEPCRLRLRRYAYSSQMAEYVTDFTSRLAIIDIGSSKSRL